MIIVKAFICFSLCMQVVFNVVASVKFNEKLRDAVEINVLGTKKILDLVMGIKNLKVSMHYSFKQQIWNIWIDGQCVPFNINVNRGKFYFTVANHLISHIISCRENHRYN